MRFITNLLTGFLKNQTHISFEERMTLVVCYYLTFMGIISTLAHLFLQLGQDTVLLLFVSTVILCGAFIAGRFYKKLLFLKWILTLYFFVFNNVYWYVNFGSHGTAIYSFVVYFCAMVIIWDGIRAWIITMMILLNLLVLLLIEYFKPVLTGNYPAEEARIMDSYLTLLMIIGFISIIIINVKNNYIKQYKLAQRSDQLKSAFLANISHEIRTPLNAILGFSQLITKRKMPVEKMEYYTRLISDNGKYLMKLVSDILDISLIESGQLKVFTKKFDLNELFQKMYHNNELVMKELGCNRVELILDTPSEPFLIDSDELRIEQIMSNLVNNAIKFTAEGYIKMGFYSGRDQLIFFVKDTGSGIRSEFKEEIFNRFVKNEDEIENNSARGAGIGLALCKELVLLLGGKIWFESVHLKGSAFYFSLPYKNCRSVGLGIK